MLASNSMAPKNAHYDSRIEPNWKRLQLHFPASLLLYCFKSEILRNGAAMAIAPEIRSAQPQANKAAVSLVDVDVHNYVPTASALYPYMTERWSYYCQHTNFERPPADFYPRFYRNAARRDAFPPGGIPGSDSAFSAQQLLDRYGIDYGILNCLYPSYKMFNIDLANALTKAVNDWQIEHWLEADPRWRASILINPHDINFSIEEIKRCAQHGGYVQVMMLARTHAPLGRREFWPIYAAAQELGLPIGIHFGGGLTSPITPSGWPSYYIEDHTGMAQAFQSQVLSLVCEGVFVEYSKLRVVLIEGGFAWMPPLMWRLDKNWKGLRGEIPWLTKPPSDYIREHIRCSTQPMEEPDDPRHLAQIIEMLGTDDLLLFATDYPHWDFDSPERSLPASVGKRLRERIFSQNALAVYDFERG